MEWENMGAMPLIEGTLRTLRNGEIEQVENGKWIKLETEQ